MATRGHDKARLLRVEILTLYNACAAGHLAGVRLIDSPATVPRPVRKYGKLSELQDQKRREQAFSTERWDAMNHRWR